VKLYRVIVATGPPTRPMPLAEAMFEVRTLVQMNAEANARAANPASRDRLKPLRVVKDVSTTPGVTPGADDKGATA
jgi:hypothetical protein